MDTLEIPALYESLSLIVALLVAIIGHEIMHGYVAYRYGDTTAQEAGRLTINPLVHIDPIGSILLPAILYFSGSPFLFGWAKPVPVDSYVVLRNGGYNAGIAVSLAGIAYNFSLALLASILFGLNALGGMAGEVVALFLFQLMIYNVLLGVFNLFPIPPLDGSRALGYACLKYRFSAIPRLFDRLEPYAMIILVVLLVATPLLDWCFELVRFILGFLL